MPKHDIWKRRKGVRWGRLSSWGKALSKRRRSEFVTYMYKYISLFFPRWVPFKSGLACLVSFWFLSWVSCFFLSLFPSGRVFLKAGLTQGGFKYFWFCLACVSTWSRLPFLSFNTCEILFLFIMTFSSFFSFTLGHNFESVSCTRTYTDGQTDISTYIHTFTLTHTHSLSLSHTDMYTRTTHSQSCFSLVVILFFLSQFSFSECSEDLSAMS